MFNVFFFNRPLIFYAFEYNDNELLKLMLDNGAKTNVTHLSGYTPLTYSVMRNDYTKASILIQAGANPLQEETDGEHRNSFSYAPKSGALFDLLCTVTDYFLTLVRTGRYDEALSMIDRKVILTNFIDPRNPNTNLHSLASESKDINFMIEIHKRTFDPQKEPFNDILGSILYTMCTRHDLEGVRIVAAKMGGTESEHVKKCWDNSPPIVWALRNGQYAVAEILLDAGFNPNHPFVQESGAHDYALNNAAQIQNTETRMELVRKLLYKGADANTFSEHFSPALVAMHYGHTDVLYELKSNKNSNYIPFLYNYKTYEKNRTLNEDIVSQKDKELNEKMFECAEKGDFEGVLACLDVADKGYVVKPLSVNSMSIANHAENLISVFLGKHRNFEVAEKLIGMGATVANSCILEDGVSKPLFYYACERKDEELMKFLLGHKADIYAACSDGANVLTLAITNNYVGLARWLSHTKRSSEYIKSSVRPPLHLACELGRRSIVRILVENFGADVNERVNYGFTPLHIVAKTGSLPIASYLLRHGADTGLRAIDDDSFKNNGSALDIARYYGNFSVSRLILDPRENDLEALSSEGSGLGLSSSAGDGLGASGAFFQGIPGEPFEGECSICFEETTLVALSCCGHAFCRDCLNDWFMAQFDGFTRLRCPWNGCNALCSWYDIIYNVRDRSKFEDFYLKKALRSMDDFRWCPKCNFGGFVECRKAVCLYCGYKFCAECLGEYHTDDCMKLYERNSEEFFSNKWLKSNTKPCPKCSVVIYKDGGCSHVKCLHCDYEFCWICMGPYIGLYSFDGTDPCATKRR